VGEPERNRSTSDAGARERETSDVGDDAGHAQASRSPELDASTVSGGELVQPPLADAGAHPRNVVTPSDDYTTDCAGYESRLVDCGLLGEGDFNCQDPQTASDRCAYACLTVATCNILWRSACTESIPSPLQNCLTACFSFICDDGRMIPSSYQCDGVADCFGGADEVGCPTFTCGSGEVVPANYRCDFVAECPDESDEEDCEVFTCDSGQRLPPWFECDFEQDCPDGSDERDCGYFECEATSTLLPPEWQCDQVDDCLDGSDEVGCAQFTCQ
jgi:hypothetical protein